jgi:MFS family permease
MSTPNSRPSLAYPWFVVAILMVAYVFSFVDRQILNLLVGPVRRDLGISDTQMSLLMGFSFAILYTVLGIPIGRLADNRSRRGLIVAGLVVWSIMTALCGTARHYWQLFLYRVGVGVGEASLSPAAYSMIADYFPPDRRATAISVYSMGIYLGTGLAFLLGGLVIRFVAAQGEVSLPLIGATRPWQLVFLILGAAGVLFSLAFLFVREPARQGAAAEAVPLREVIGYLRTHRRTVLCHNVGFALLALCSYGSGAWIPTFFVRTHGWQMGDTGIVYGLMVMVFGSAGMLFGGLLADRWSRQGKADAAMRVGLYSGALALVSGLAYPAMPTGMLAALALVPSVFALGMPFGAAAAAIQDIVPNRMRGQTSAVFLFVVNLIGLGLGPTAVALITDYVFADDLALRWSLLIVSLASSTAALLVLAAGRAPYRATLAALKARQAEA